MKYSFSSKVQSLQSSVVRDILKLTQGGDMISFAGGLPAEELFPVQAVKDAAVRALDGGPAALQYGLTEGYLPLREQLAERMARKGIHASPEQMLLTTGSQQAIDLLVSILTEPGDTVLVEKPTYLACLQVFAMHGLKVIAAESDEDGMIPEDVERLIAEHRPKIMYAVPTFGNPTGRVWSMERRLKLLQLCKAYGVLIIEDDPYGDISFDGQQYSSLLSLDESVENSNVIYTSTFSKIAAPALRTGWAIGDSRVMRMMAKAKQASDLQSSSLDQQIISQLLMDFDIDAHITLISEAYGSRMEEMNRHLAAAAVREMTWNKPKGGMFLWLTLPEGLDSEALLRCAVGKGMAFVPGTAFYAYEPKRNTARLNFSFCTGERMERGIARFIEAIGEFTARS